MVLFVDFRGCLLKRLFVREVVVTKLSIIKSCLCKSCFRLFLNRNYLKEVNNELINMIGNYRALFSKVWASGRHGYL